MKYVLQIVLFLVLAAAPRTSRTLPFFFEGLFSDGVVVAIHECDDEGCVMGDLSAVRDSLAARGFSEEEARVRAERHARGSRIVVTFPRERAKDEGENN